MNLIDTTKQLVGMRKKWLDESELALKKLEQLPLELKELEGTSADVTSDKLYLGFPFQVGIIDVLKAVGVYDLTYSASDYSDSWTLTGEYDLPDGMEVKISVSNAVTPAHCRIEKYEEMQQVTRFRAICEEDGKQIHTTTKV